MLDWLIDWLIATCRRQYCRLLRIRYLCYGLKRDSRPTALGMHKRSDAHNAPPPGGFFVGENIYCDNGKWLIDQPFTKLHSSFLILIHEVIPSRPINNWDISVSEMCISSNTCNTIKHLDSNTQYRTHLLHTRLSISPVATSKKVSK